MWKMSANNVQNKLRQCFPAFKNPVTNISRQKKKKILTSYNNKTSNNKVLASWWARFSRWINCPITLTILLLWRSIFFKILSIREKPRNLNWMWIIYFCIIWLCSSIWINHSFSNPAVLELFWSKNLVRWQLWYFCCPYIFLLEVKL